jgi:SAM-dependent methyltransferase
VTFPEDLFRCAACAGVVTRRADGAWTCAAGHVFPEVDGIPRFVGTGTPGVETGAVESFGFQWTTFDVSDQTEDAQVFREKTALDLAQLRGRLVLDAGCGGGRYAKLAGEAGAAVVALDLSDAVRHARQLTAHLPNVRVVQGNLLAPPLAPASFDVVYSIGVLHHTPDTRRAFDAIARLVKPGGHLAVWLYRRNTLPQEILNSGLRQVTTRLPRAALLLLSRAGATVGGLPGLKHLNKVVNFSAHPRWTTRVCDTFDWWAPPFQTHHSEAELLEWFAAAGFERVTLLHPERAGGSAYGAMYRRNLLIGSGVNAAGTRRSC